LAILGDKIQRRGKGCKWCEIFYAEYEALFVNGKDCLEIQSKLIKHMQKEGLLK